MTEPGERTGPPTRWLWVALLVLLAIGALIVLLGPERDEDTFSVNDAAEATVTSPDPATAPRAN